MDNVLESLSSHDCRKNGNLGSYSNLFSYNTTFLRQAIFIYLQIYIAIMNKPALPRIKQS